MAIVNQGAGCERVVSAEPLAGAGDGFGLNIKGENLTRGGD